MRQIKMGLLSLDYLLGVIIIACQLFALRDMASALFYGTFFVTLILWVSTLFDSVNDIDILAIFIIVLAFSNVLVNGISSGAEVSFQYFKKYIMFSCTVIFFASAVKLELEKRTIKFLNICYAGTGALFLLVYLFGGRRIYYISGRYSSYLTFGFTNPNLTAIFLSCIVMYLVVIANAEKNIYKKIIFFAIVTAEIFFVFKTRSRNALLATAIFIVIFAVEVLFKKRLKIKKWMLAIAAVFPLVFALLYLQLVQRSVVQKYFSFIIEEGKKLSSRISIWRPALKEFQRSPFFGAYYQISNGTGMSQLHNTHIDILSSYGVVVLILVCVYLYKVMCRANAQGTDRSVSTKMLIAFVCTILLGTGEAALFSGGLGIYLFVGIFLLTPSFEGGKKNKNEISIYK